MQTVSGKQNAVVSRREETERRLPMIVISKCKKETRILVRIALWTSTIFGKFWQIFRVPGARPRAVRCGVKKYRLDHRLTLCF